MNKKIAIIGGGNLGVAITEGLIASGFALPQHVIVTKRNIKTLQKLEEKGVLVSNDNKEAVHFADLIILAVKPFQIRDVLRQIAPLLQQNRHILVSVVTGVPISVIVEEAKQKVPVVRAMPNTAIAIQESMTCLTAHEVGDADISYIEDLFNQLGRIVWIDEKLMDAATVLGACGTAYAKIGRASCRERV